MLAIFITVQTVIKSGELLKKPLAPSIKLLSPNHPEVNLAVAPLSRYAGRLLFNMFAMNVKQVLKNTPANWMSWYKEYIVNSFKVNVFDSAADESSVRWLGASVVINHQNHNVNDHRN